jgi:hypothetical protein
MAQRKEGHNWDKNKYKKWTREAAREQAVKRLVAEKNALRKREIMGFCSPGPNVRAKTTLRCKPHDCYVKKVDRFTRVDITDIQEDLDWRDGALEYYWEGTRYNYRFRRRYYKIEAVACWQECDLIARWCCPDGREYSASHRVKLWGTSDSYWDKHYDERRGKGSVTVPRSMFYVPPEKWPQK